jgi:hypothetical protein
VQQTDIHAPAGYQPAISASQRLLLSVSADEKPPLPKHDGVTNRVAQTPPKDPVQTDLTQDEKNYM